MIKIFISKFKKLIAAIIGMPIFLLGIVITPIPPPFPPGWPVALLGLWILSFGFDWAEKRRLQIVKKIKKVWHEAFVPFRAELKKQKKEKEKDTPENK